MMDADGRTPPPTRERYFEVSFRELEDAHSSDFLWSCFLRFRREFMSAGLHGENVIWMTDTELNRQQASAAATAAQLVACQEERDRFSELADRRHDALFEAHRQRDAVAAQLAEAITNSNVYRRSWMGAEGSRQQLTAQLAEREAALEQAKGDGPGDRWVCRLCGFMLTKAILRASDGAIGMDAREIYDVCPNDGASMRRVTWKEDAADANRLALEQMERADVAEAKVTVLKQQLSIQEERTGTWHQYSDTLEAEATALRAALAQLELRIEHARKQGAADGFQQGWHSALLRICSGDSIDELSQLVPKPAALAAVRGPSPKSEK